MLRRAHSAWIVFCDHSDDAPNARCGAFFSPMFRKPIQLTRHLTVRVPVSAVDLGVLGSTVDLGYSGVLWT